MDPLTQGVLGASLSQANSPSRHLLTAGLLGFIAGMAPDLDVLIRSKSDPLLFLEYHRQFTHSLIFVPVGGLLCGLLLHALLGKRRGLSLSQSVLYYTLGYATHALLDACTSYGTLLLWPFSDQLFAWNIISIIDPLYTLPLLILVVSAAARKNPTLARIALAWAIIYPALGLLQRNRAVDAGWALAEQRGHQVSRLEAKPSFANLLLWKTIYETQHHYYVDAVRVGLQTATYPGDRINKLNIARDLPWLNLDSQQALDIERFRWFSNGYIAADPLHRYRIIDIRYSLSPDEIKPLWGIELSPDASPWQHASYLNIRNAPADSARSMLRMLLD